MILDQQNIPVVGRLQGEIDHRPLGEDAQRLLLVVDDDRTADLALAQRRDGLTDRRVRGHDDRHAQGQVPDAFLLQVLFQSNPEVL